jgi:hypothetical protein
MTKFKQIKQEIENIYKNSDCSNPSDREKDPTHSKLTLEWVLKLKPDADDALKIAALGHDIDRAIENRRVKKEDYDDYDRYKQKHAIESAKVITEFLKKYKCNKNIIRKVRYLIENHEVGGTNEANTLRDADSLTFFNFDINYYLKDKGIEKTKDKIKFMYDRLSNDAKTLVRSIKFNKRIKVIFRLALKE